MRSEHVVRPAQLAHLQSMASLAHQARAAADAAERDFLLTVRGILAGEVDGGNVVTLDAARNVIVLETDDAPGD